MAGQIHKMLEQIVTERSRGSATIAITTRTKLMLKGIDTDKYTAFSPDDPAIIARVRQVAAELNVSI